MNRKTELSRLNIWFCFMVILIHILSPGISGLNPASWQYAAVLVVQRLCFVSVPGFFMLSGIKLMLNRTTRFQPGKYYLRRAKTILLPYLIAVTVYILYFQRLGWIQLTAGNLTQYYLLGTIAAHLYYVPAILQFMLLAPLWFYIVRKLPAEFAVPAAICITLLSTRYLGQYISGYNDRVFTSYLYFFLAGCYIGRDYTAFLQKLRQCRVFFVGLAVLMLLADAVLSVVHFSRGIAVDGLTEIHLIYEAAAFFALLLLADSLQSWRLCGLERVIDSCSYLIYLYHVFFIQIFEWQLHITVTEIGVLLVLRLIFVCTTTILASWLWKKLAGCCKKQFLKLKRMTE